MEGLIITIIISILVAFLLLGRQYRVHTELKKKVSHLEENTKLNHNRMVEDFNAMANTLKAKDQKMLKSLHKRISNVHADGKATDSAIKHVLDLIEERFEKNRNHMNRFVEAYNLLADELGYDFKEAETITKELPARVEKVKKNRKRRK